MTGIAILLGVALLTTAALYRHVAQGAREQLLDQMDRSGEAQFVRDRERIRMT